MDQEEYELLVSDKYNKITKELSDKLDSGNLYDKIATDAKLWCCEKFYKNYMTYQVDAILDMDFTCTKYDLEYLELTDKDKVIGWCKIKSSRRSFEILECDMIELNKHDSYELFNYLINAYEPDK